MNKNEQKITITLCLCTNNCKHQCLHVKICDLTCCLLEEPPIHSPYPWWCVKFCAMMMKSLEKKSWNSGLEMICKSLGHAIINVAWMSINFSSTSCQPHKGQFSWSLQIESSSCRVKSNYQWSSKLFKRIGGTCGEKCHNSRYIGIFGNFLHAEMKTWGILEFIETFVGEHNTDINTNQYNQMKLRCNRWIMQMLKF